MAATILVFAWIQRNGLKAELSWYCRNINKRHLYYRIAISDEEIVLKRAVMS